MLTAYEAWDRAGKIWGGSRVLKCVKSGPDAWWISLKPARSPARQLRTADLQTQHTLDTNGHAVCHAACEKLEKAVARG